MTGEARYQEWVKTPAVSFLLGTGLMNDRALSNALLRAFHRGQFDGSIKQLTEIALGDRVVFNLGVQRQRDIVRELLKL